MSDRRRKAEKRKNKNTGSSPKGEPVFLVVGRLQRPHGLKGEILMGIMTDFPDRLQPDTKVYIGGEYQPSKITSTRHHSSGLLVRLEEYQTREDVGKLRNKFVHVRADDRPQLPEGEYYHHELIGLRVITEKGALIGSLNEILETGANDVYVVKPDEGKELLLPAIDEVVLIIDVDEGEITVKLLEGLAE